MGGWEAELRCMVLNPLGAERGHAASGSVLSRRPDTLRSTTSGSWPSHLEKDSDRHWRWAVGARTVPVVVAEAGWEVLIRLVTAQAASWCHTGRLVLALVRQALPDAGVGIWWGTVQVSHLSFSAWK